MTEEIQAPLEVSIPERKVTVCRHQEIALEGLKRLSYAPNLCGMGGMLDGQEGKMLTIEAFLLALSYGPNTVVKAVVDVLTFLGFKRNERYTKDRDKRRLKALNRVLACSLDSTAEELEEAAELLHLRWRERKGYDN